MKNNNNNTPTLSQVKKLNYTHVSRICIYGTKITNGVLNLGFDQQIRIYSIWTLENVLHPFKKAEILATHNTLNVDVKWK